MQEKRITRVEFHPKPLHSEQPSPKKRVVAYARVSTMKDAQEESRSISENVTWGQRKRFSDGKVSIPYGQFLGYCKGADGLPEIVPEEAEIVRRIYTMFMDGKSTKYILTIIF